MIPCSCGNSVSTLHGGTLLLLVRLTRNDRGDYVVEDVRLSVLDDSIPHADPPAPATEPPPSGEDLGSKTEKGTIF